MLYVSLKVTHNLIRVFYNIILLVYDIELIIYQQPEELLYINASLNGMSVVLNSGAYISCLK
jgi:hypothetical protein